MSFVTAGFLRGPSERTIVKRKEKKKKKEIQNFLERKISGYCKYLLSTFEVLNFCYYRGSQDTTFRVKYYRRDDGVSR